MAEYPSRAEAEASYSPEDLERAITDYRANSEPVKQLASLALQDKENPVTASALRAFADLADAMGGKISSSYSELTITRGSTMEESRNSVLSNRVYEMYRERKEAEAKAEAEANGVKVNDESS